MILAWDSPFNTSDVIKIETSDVFLTCVVCQARAYRYNQELYNYKVCAI